MPPPGSPWPGARVRRLRSAPAAPHPRAAWYAMAGRREARECAHDGDVTIGDHVSMTHDLDQRSAAGREILLGLGRLTPGQARRIAIRPADAFSAERRAARAQARAVARDLDLLGALDGLLRDAARAADVPVVPERSRDAFRQVTTDAAVSAFLGGDLEEEARELLARPLSRAIRRRRTSDPRPADVDGPGAAPDDPG